MFIKVFTQAPVFMCVRRIEYRFTVLQRRKTPPPFVVFHVNPGKIKRVECVNVTQKGPRSRNGFLVFSDLFLTWDLLGRGIGTWTLA